LNVVVDTNFASLVTMKRTHQSHVPNSQSGRRKILAKQKQVIGLEQIQKNALNVAYQLKKMEDVTT